jgi:hypothetical protein
VTSLRAQTINDLDRLLLYKYCFCFLSLNKVIVLTADKGSIKDWTEIQFIETCSFHSRSFDNIESSFLAEKTSCYKKGFAKTETMVETTLPSYTLKC